MHPLIAPGADLSTGFRLPLMDAIQKVNKKCVHTIAFNPRQKTLQYGVTIKTVLLYRPPNPFTSEDPSLISTMIGVSSRPVASW